MFIRCFKLTSIDYFVFKGEKVDVDGLLDVCVTKVGLESILLLAKFP